MAERICRVSALRVAVAAPEAWTALSAPYGVGCSPRQVKAAKKSLKLRAIQTPLPLSALNAVHYIPDRTQVDVEDMDGNEGLIVELRSQLEDLWCDFASSRRRNHALMEENEQLQSKLRALEASLRQEQYARKEAQEELRLLKEATESCNL